MRDTFYVFFDQFSKDKIVMTQDYHICIRGQNIGVSYLKVESNEIGMRLSSIYPESITYDTKEVEILFVNDDVLRIPIIIPTKQIDYNSGRVTIDVVLNDDHKKLLRTNVIKGVRVSGIMTAIKRGGRRSERLTEQLGVLIDTDINDF